MATTSAPLNAEPADSQSRKEQNLPPKSFADAVQEEAPLHINGDGEAKSLNGANKSNGLPGINGQENAETGDGDQKSNGGHQAAILKIVDTHGEAEGKTIANGEVKKEQKEDDSSRPVIERQESRSEYSATVSTLLRFRRDIAKVRAQLRLDLLPLMNITDGRNRASMNLHPKAHSELFGNPAQRNPTV